MILLTVLARSLAVALPAVLTQSSCLQVRELVVDSCRSADGEVEGVTEEFSALEVLSMVNVGLGSLAKLPVLPKLRKVGPVPEGSGTAPTRTLTGTVCFSWR